MFKKQLCPHCETGKKMYELDCRATECPYMLCHNGKKCGMYKGIKKESKFISFLRKIIKNSKFHDFVFLQPFGFDRFFR